MARPRRLSLRPAVYERPHFAASERAGGSLRSVWCGQNDPRCLACGPKRPICGVWELGIGEGAWQVLPRIGFAFAVSDAELASKIFLL
jgi:hypothetical protein